MFLGDRCRQCDAEAVGSRWLKQVRYVEAKGLRRRGLLLLLPCRQSRGHLELDYMPQLARAVHLTT